jgi:hypothetical protein
MLLSRGESVGPLKTSSSTPWFIASGFWEEGKGTPGVPTGIGSTLVAWTRSDIKNPHRS